MQTEAWAALVAELVVQVAMQEAAWVEQAVARVDLQQ